MRALVVGGTGPTGPGIVRGLLERGYEVTIYHRGLHEPAGLPPTAHLHGDPFDREAIARDLGGSSWDLVCSMYGRLRYVADAMAGRCGRFIGIGSSGGNLPRAMLPPTARGFPSAEDHPLHLERAPGYEFGWAIAETERLVMAQHQRGAFAATMLRYCEVYGPGAPLQWLWPIVRRVLDGRTTIVLPADTPTIFPLCHAQNAVHHVLLAVDRAEAIGQVFNVADSKAFFSGDVVAIVSEALDHPLHIEFVNHPLAHYLARGYFRSGFTGTIQLDTFKARSLLGYADVVPPGEGLAAVARWLAGHRTELNEAELDRAVPNPYAYELEDTVVRQQSELSRTLDALHALVPAAPVAPYSRDVTS